MLGTNVDAIADDGARNIVVNDLNDEEKRVILLFRNMDQPTKDLVLSAVGVISGQ